METGPEADDFGVNAQDIPDGGDAPSLVELTPQSVVVDMLIWSGSPASSGLIVYRDFGAAVRDLWYRTIVTGSVEKDRYDEGQRAFQALYDRWREQGYSDDMGAAFAELVSTYDSDYTGTHVMYTLPDDLEDVLEWCFPESDRTDWPEGVPEHAEFDLNNPEHLALLQQALEEMVD